MKIASIFNLKKILINIDNIKKIKILIIIINIKNS